MKKDEYVLRCLSKIRHKKWEYFVVSRIVHQLIGQDIEFVCQQPVRRENGNPYLTDLFFPQLGLHLEIDERHHAKEQLHHDDIKRSQDIINATGHEIVRLKVFQGVEHSIRTLNDISAECDCFVEKLLSEKKRRLNEGTFQPWDYESRFSPQPHISRGYIDLKSNAVFRTHKDALTCFGYKGGHYFRAAWTLPYDSKRMVWFPKLYINKDWENNLSSDGKMIEERAKSSAWKAVQLRGKSKWDSRIVFAHYTDELGATLYRFLGEFSFDPEISGGSESAWYKQISTCVKLPGCQPEAF